MAERKPEWREAGNSIVTSIKTVTNYGAYVDFHENNKYILVANKACEPETFRRED